MKIFFENKYFIFDRPRKYNLSRFLYCLKCYLKSMLYEIFLKIDHPHYIEKKYTVSICGIFKNEGLYLKEWIEYHHLIGVQHFYLYNNNSSDNYKEILEPYVRDGIVTLVEFPYDQAQMKAYMECLKNYSHESNWIGFIDIDEFVVPLKNNNILDVLNRFKTSRGSVLFYWKMFGAGGYMSRDVRGLVSEDFIVAAPKHSDIGKCFYNTLFDFDFLSKRNHNGLHHLLWTKYKLFPLPPVDIWGNFVFSDCVPNPKGEFEVQINHYATKSYDEFKMKKNKGDVFFKINPHDEAYFHRLNRRCNSLDYSIYNWLVLLKKNILR